MRNQEAFGSFAVVDALRDHIAILDPFGLILFVNKSWSDFAQANGLAKEAAGPGVNYLEVCQQAGPDSPEAGTVARAIRDAAAGNQDAFTIDYPCHSPGQKRWFTLTITAFRGEENKTFVVAAHQDITSRKLAEEERIELLVREQKLRQEAEELAQMRDQFYSVLAHEFRNPVSIILGWSKILQTDSEKDLLARGLEVINRNCFALSRLMNDFLDVFRLASGKLEIRPVPIDLCPLVESAVESVQPHAREKNLDVKLLPPPADCLVIADKDRILQVICNLLLNAIKFTADGEIIVTMSKTASLVAVEVKDSGLGIPADILPQIFDPFKQASVKYGGLGLGLMVAKNLVELQGGTITAQSEGEGKGSKFTVSLPLLTPGLLERKETYME